MDLAFDIGATAPLIKRARFIRDEVFVKEQMVPLEEEWDGKDKVCIHFLVADDTGVDVGTGRLMVLGDTAKLQRIAVLQRARGLSIGAQLIKRMLDYAADEPGVTRALLGAQCHAIPFYEKLGFQAFGDIYDDAGIPHRDMERTL